MSRWDRWEHLDSQWVKQREQAIFRTNQWVVAQDSEGELRAQHFWAKN